MKGIEATFTGTLGRDPELRLAPLEFAVAGCGSLRSHFAT